MSNGLTWVKGMNSPNPTGRKPGSKGRNPLASLKRWYSRNGTVKELDRLYNALQTDRDKLDMMRSVWAYLLPRPQSDAISAEEAQQLYEKQVSLEQRNKILEKQLKDLSNVGEEKAI